MNSTKAAIIEMFWQLLDKKPYSKITVKDIVTGCQINRNTFYYYFQDIPDLLQQTTEDYADSIIQNYSRFSSLADCLVLIIDSCRERKRALLHIYKSMQREVFLTQLERTVLYVVTRYISTAEKESELSEEDRSMLVWYYKCTLVGIFLDWLDKDMAYDLQQCFVRIQEL